CRVVRPGAERFPTSRAPAITVDPMIYSDLPLAANANIDLAADGATAPVRSQDLRVEAARGTRRSSRSRAQPRHHRRSQQGTDQYPTDGGNSVLTRAQHVILFFALLTYL